MHELKNQMEEIVERLVVETMAEYPICRCHKCQLDVMALVLNRLPGHYVVTERGGLFARIDATLLQNQTDTLSAVIQAIMTVQTHPHHEAEQPDGDPGEKSAHD